MRHLLRLAIGNWSANPGRTCAVVLSVALGVGTVVVITNLYETARRGITDEVVTHWMGAAHVTVHPVGAHWASIDASVAKELGRLDNVQFVTARLRRRVRLSRAQDVEPLVETDWRPVDAIGIEWENERHFRALPRLVGRMFRPGERGAAVIESELAREWGLALNDDISLTPYYGGRSLRLKIVGVFDSRRVAEFQQPSVYLPLIDLQELRNEPGIATVIDLKLADPSPQAMEAVRAAVEKHLADRHFPYPYRVETAVARQRVLAEAQRVTRLILMLIAFVALLTSFFIILTTQGVSLVRRRAQLGVMRCIGLTRAQLSTLLFFELVTLGVTGTLLGIVGGLGATRVVAVAASDMVIRVYLSGWGIGLGAISGIVTTLVSAGVLILQVGRVTPMEAVNREARPVRMRFVYIAGVVGLVMLAVHQRMADTSDHLLWLNTAFAGAGTVLLYLGYALLAPTAVVWLGRPFARMVGRLMGLHAKLVDEPFVQAPWRTTGACWVLMVGLSMIVFTAVRSEGVLAIWDFPARLPSAFVWTPKYVSGDTIERVRRLPGVGTVTVTTDVTCEIKTPPGRGSTRRDSIIERFLKRLTRPVFVAGQPEALLRMLKITFVEGSREEALRKIERGGYVLIPTPTSRNHDLHLGDRVTVTVGGRSASFEIAGVIQSPALDLAVTAFQAESYMQFAAASAILGTRADLQKRFGLDVVSMFMCDFDLRPATTPPGFSRDTLPANPNERNTAELFVRWKEHLPEEQDTYSRIAAPLRVWLQANGSKDVGLAARAPAAVREELKRFARALRWVRWSSQTKNRSDEENWQTFRERLLLYKIAQVMGRPEAITGSLSYLHELLVESLRRAIAVLTWLPSIMLVVAAIGIANLMMVSVHLRTRSIAVLRAAGAQKSQILRLVLAEALAIGLLGSVMGVALGLHEAYSDNLIVSRLIHVSLDFIVPVPTIIASVVLTVALCVAAGVAPARHAARSNIIQAIQAA